MKKEILPSDIWNDEKREGIKGAILNHNMNKYCKKCKNKIVLDAFSYGNCELCNEEISTPHIPADKICPKCAKENELCESCGNKIEKE